MLQVEVPLKQDAQKKFVRQTSFWGRLGKWTNQALGGPFHLDKGKVPSLDDQFTSLTGETGKKELKTEEKPSIISLPPGSERA